MRRPFSRTHPAAGARETWAACSVLLDYPTDELLGSLDAITSLVPGNPPVADLVRYLRSHDLRTAQQEYVATFDHARRCALHLTYYAYGDTRRRGAALVQFKQAYRDAGAEWDESSGELPDHLCAVLQLGATIDAAAAWKLLVDHRAGLEMLRIALAGWHNDDGTVGSPWHGAVRAVVDTLPELAGDEVDAVRRLIAQGPPAEEVGLGGYGADPALSPTLISGSTIPVGAPR